MSIDQLFRKNPWYAPDAILKTSPSDTAKRLIAFFCREYSDEAQVKVHYKERGEVVCDTIPLHCFDADTGKLDVVRELSIGGSSVKCRSLDSYLEGVHELYLELKDKQHEFGIGIEHSPEGSKLGHYLTR
jgi:hypothetical protein